MRPLTEIGRPRGETDRTLEMKNSILAVASLRCWFDTQKNTGRQPN